MNCRIQFQSSEMWGDCHLDQTHFWVLYYLCFYHGSSSRPSKWLLTMADAVSCLCLLFGSFLWDEGRVWLMEIWYKCKGDRSSYHSFNKCFLSIHFTRWWINNDRVYFLNPLSSSSCNHHWWRCPIICHVCIPWNLYLS